MKNLKRIFSLALAGTMLAGMLTIGASAAQFTDDEDIKNNDAVNFMVALNIINGNDDGSFAPDRVVTRAEMAKMITVALNGGVDPVLGTQTNPTYSDIKGHWAEKYIEYCSNLGIIAGRGNGTFDPNGTVTGTEVAKMALVAMGYNSDIRQYTGADWDTNVNVDANNAQPNKLYAGLEAINPSEGISRDNAAQILFNAVQDYMMIRRDAISIQDGKVTFNYYLADGSDGGDPKTILSEKYGYEVKYGYMTDAKATDDGYDYLIDAGKVAKIGAPAIAANKAFDNDGSTTGTVTYSEDVSNLFAQRVKIIYKAETLEAVGIYAADNNVLFEGAASKLPNPDHDATTAKIDGSTYRFAVAKTGTGVDTTADKVNIVYHLDSAMTSHGTLGKTAGDVDNHNDKKEWNVKVIDNDGDGRINVIVATPIVLGKVTYLGKTTVNVAIAPNASVSRKLEDEINVYEDVKKDDYVIYTDKAYTVDDKDLIVPAETVEGTVDSTRGSGNANNVQVKIDGTWYTPADVMLTSGNTTMSASYLNKDVELILINGFYAHAEAAKVVSEDILLVTKVDDNPVTFTNDKIHQAQVTFLDGSTKVVNAKTDEDAVAYNIDDAGVPGNFFTYEMDGNTYILTPATVATTGYDKAVANAQYTPTAKWWQKMTVNGTDINNDGIIDNGSTFYIDEDAVVIVGYKTGHQADPDNVAAGDYIDTQNDVTDISKVSVLKGSALKKWATGNYGTIETTVGFSNTINGLNYVQVLFMSFDANELPSGTGTEKYGYIVSNPVRTRVNGETWTSFTMWTGSEELDVTEKGDRIFSASNYKQGSAICYEDLGDGEVKVKSIVRNSGAITGFGPADEVVEFVGNDGNSYSYAVDDDTQIIYINSADKEGAEGEGLQLAGESATAGKLEQNIIIVGSGSPKHADVIFVDVNNKIADTADVTDPNP